MSDNENARYKSGQSGGLANAKREEAEIEKPNSATWSPVVEFSGSSIKSTEAFDIAGDEWRINWSTEPGAAGPQNFQIYVYNANGELKDLAANIIGNGSDSSVIRGAGRYYLQFNTGQPYKVSVEQYN